MTNLILDASALLALLNEEPNTERWAAAVKDAAISAVNFSEVVAKLTDAGMNEAEIRAVLDPLGVSVEAFDVGLAYLAGLLRPQTKGIGLSLGDRACLALGRHMRLPVLTADRAWAKLRVGVEIRVIR